MGEEEADEERTGGEATWKLILVVGKVKKSKWTMGNQISRGIFNTGRKYDRTSGEEQ